jgi:hypothetical protein
MLGTWHTRRNKNVDKIILGELQRKRLIIGRYIADSRKKRIVRM